MRRSVILSLLLAVGCGGTPEADVRTRSGPTQFTGVSSQFRRSGGSISGQPFQMLAVGVFDIPPWCYPTDGGTGPTTLSTLGIEIIQPGSEAVGSGTWSASRPGGGLLDGAIGYYQRLVTDQPDVWLEVVSGSVKLSRADDVAVEGEVDLKLEDGTHLAGQLSATHQCIR